MNMNSISLNDVRKVATLDLTVVVLSYNEERHLARCLSSLLPIAKDILVVDSFSTDRTVEIALKHGARVLQNPFVNHAIQLNWGLDHGDICTQWVMRLDADEVVTHGLAEALLDKLPFFKTSVGGLTINRQFHLLGQWIRFGGLYPVRTLRIWRNGKGVCENRWMDEHVIVEGEIFHVNSDIADINLNNITWWINKHNNYASREAIDLLLLEYEVKAEDSHSNGMSIGGRVKRWIKNTIYSRLPMGLRALMYFVYRYVFKLGFLDGWRGLVLHSLHALWYRFLVDVKVFEIKLMMAERKQGLREVIKSEYGYDI
jgi:glycosyltransferase involved in cell wall biosynthesis